MTETCPSFKGGSFAHASTQQNLSSEMCPPDPARCVHQTQRDVRVCVWSWPPVRAAAQKEARPWEFESCWKIRPAACTKRDVRAVC